MSPTTAELLFEVLNVGILGLGLGWLLFRPVRAALAAETRERAEREEALVSREAELAEAQAALDARRASFDADLQLRSTRILDAARAEASEAEAASAAAIEARRVSWEAEQGARVSEEAHASTRAAASVAAGAVRRLLTSAQGPDLDLALARAALDALPATRASVVVEVAAPPSEALGALLEERLAAGVTVRVRPELGAGVRIVSEAGLVDASALGLAADAADAVEAGLSSGKPGG